MSEKTKNKHPLLWLQVLRLLVLLAPSSTVFVVKRASFLVSANGSVSFTLAGTICMILLLLLLFSLPRSSGLLFAFGAIFVICTMLSSFLEGASLVSGIAFLCKLVDKMALVPWYGALREKLLVQKTARSTASEVERVLEQYAGRV